MIAVGTLMLCYAAAIAAVTVHVELSTKSIHGPEWQMYSSPLYTSCLLVQQQ